MKNYLDSLVQKYETEDFIKSDPVQFCHIFKNDRIENLELMGFIASIFAFGRRDAFISKLNILLEIMNHNPYEFILNFDKNEDKLNGLIYRFYKDSDLKALFFILSEMLKAGMSLGDLFYENRNPDTQKIIQGVYKYFHNSKYSINTTGFTFMMSNPEKLSANKRLNMFLRWMVRKSVVDIGVWEFIDKKDLIIPLDVHAGNVSRKLGLLKRKQNDIKAAWELTENLKRFDLTDPCKYDFALFGAGVNKDNLQVL